MNPSTRLAREIVDLLLTAGISEIVLAPGSRNAPLAFAVYAAAHQGRLRLHTRIDERTAGFVALGLGKVGRPAAVICTSGSAVANLHPAVLEAAHAGVPLVVLSADRPRDLRGTDSSQTTDQVGLFATMATCFDLSIDEIDQVPALVDEIVFADRPVQLNVAFEAPLVPDDWLGSVVSRRTQPSPSSTTVTSGVETLPSRRSLRDLLRTGVGARSSTSVGFELPLGPRTVVVAGDDAGPPARVLAEAAGWPLLAEPTAGCRTGAQAIRTYRLLLGGSLGDQIERVIVAGHPTLSRPVSRLLARDDVEVIALPHRGVWSRRAFDVSRVAEALTVPGPDDPAWLDSWREADREVSRRLDALLASEPGLTPHEVAGSVAAAVPPGGLLFVGASSPIRDLDLMLSRWGVGERRKAIANRGLAGIDGTISSAIGAALGRPQSSRAIALMGDVTYLHDHGALVLGPDEPRPDLTIVVVNDDGGSIFASLEQGAPEFADAYDTLFGTPHGVDLASLCAATRTPHWRVESLAELQHALAQPAGGIEVIEVRVRRDNRRELDARIRALGQL